MTPIHALKAACTAVLLACLAACASQPVTTTVSADCRTAVPASLVPISTAEIDRIKAIPQGRRPPPASYLPANYVARHQQAFACGASYLVPKAALDRWGRDPVGRTDGQFVSPSYEVDDMLARTHGDMAMIEKELGIPAGEWQGKAFMRIDIPRPQALDVRIPSGNESAANALWIPGGRLPTGQLEAVVNAIPAGSYTETELSTAISQAMAKP
ncbi:hypothetical protein FNU76_01360 [Chitinimonas arctica]|uniref:Uncharacterized protein n=1 Tax=Chitinimonas arctica TaxID=2594795 RepID=A0A516SAD4_9NEIS|nr:hypothetical protein [Chitinimonas arctica]QDQ25109.1 hypothetical protein FNU76_01360 [Chitinimonas arctica]